MTAYSFMRRFVPPIEAGTKRQTIRAPRAGRSRHVNVGGEMQLYTAMRTKHCRLIKRVHCAGVSPIKIGVAAGWVEIVGSHDGRAFIIRRQDSLDSFARRDGFADWDDMRQFWRETHPDVDVFSGVLITWVIP